MGQPFRAPSVADVQAKAEPENSDARAHAKLSTPWSIVAGCSLRVWFMQGWVLGLPRKNWILERAMGIEPTSEAWEAPILPLNYARSLFLIVVANCP